MEYRNAKPRFNEEATRISKVLPVYTGSIKAIQYSPASDAVTRSESRCIVSTSNTFELGKPKAGGVFDNHLGTMDSNYVCATCSLGKDKCQGHPGQIMLRCKCINPVMIQDVTKWLKIICFNCGNCIAKDDELITMRSMRPKNRIDFLSKRVTTKVSRQCPHCKQNHPAISRSETARYTFIAKGTSADGSTTDIPLYAHNIDEIFSKIKPSTVEMLGRYMISHPSAYIWSVLYVPPVTIRPDTKKPGSRGSGNDSITTYLKDIINTVTRNVKQTMPPEIDSKYGAILNALNEHIHDMLIGGNERNKSIAMRIKGKHGRFRENVLGKRADGMARSTIYGSPRLRAIQITIPLFVAQTLHVVETINDFNRARLMPFIANGERRYPGCSRIEKRNGSVFKPNSPNLRIENGDKIVRDLITGDIVAFNRQPSLTQTSITSMFIVVDSSSLAISMNPLTCVLFNADFDGDQMNVINYATEASINEQILLSGVDSHLVSCEKGSVIIGQMGDSLMGLTKLTQSGVKLDKFHACLVFATTDVLPDFSHVVASITGRQLISTLLLPINYTGKSVYYDPDSPWMKWMPPSPDDEKVQIVGGNLLKGCMDKACLGAGFSSIYQAMVHEFGAARTLECIFNMQQVGINYLSQLGFTIGIKDFIVPSDDMKKILDVSRNIEIRSKQIVAQLDRGEIVPPIDMSVDQFYEELQIAAQRVEDDYNEFVMRNIKDPRSNGAFEMMASGCKGQFKYTINMIAAVGLISINKERVPLNFGYRRSLPYFRRFDESPRSRGFVETGFMQGLSLAGCIFNMMMSRVDIIQRALMTSVTGDQNRKSIKSFESILTDNLRMTVKERDIVSFAYGGDYFDPRKLEMANYGPALISNAEFEARYHYVAQNPTNAQFFNDEFALLQAEREQYRKIFKTLEYVSLNDKVGAKIQIPFNIPRIVERMILALNYDAEGKNINDTLMRHSISIIRGSAASARDKVDKSEQTEDTLRAIAERVARFCDELPYLFVNDIQRRSHGWLPEFTISAATLVRTYIRSELCSAQVVVLRKKHPIVASNIVFVDAILEAVAITIKQAMIDPGTAVGIIAAQSFSEPFTQNMLDSYKLTALGVSSRAKMSKCQEIMSAFNVEKLSNPIMTIQLEPEFSTRERAIEVAQNIEMLQLSQLIATWNIFYERFASPIHPQFMHERAMIEQFIKDNPLLSPPTDLSNWCIRLEISKSALVQKNISIQTIIAKLRNKYSDLYFVYTNERAKHAIIRIYIRTAGLEKFSVATSEAETQITRRKTTKKSRAREERILDVYHTIANTTIRGIDGIRRTKVDKLTRTRVMEDGSIVSDTNTYGIFTSGTNLARVANVRGVIQSLLQTDAIQEIANILGIEAAHQRIITEMRGLVSSCNVRHYMIYADEMTRTGAVTSIERSGLSAREMNNIALRAGQAAPVQVLQEAAINARKDTLSGLSGQITNGSVPRVGTLYNSVVIDPEVIKKYKKTALQALGEL